MILERNYNYEYCETQKLDYLKYRANKIRRQSNHCTLLSNEEILSCILPSVIGVYVDGAFFPVIHEDGHLSYNDGIVRRTIGKINYCDDYARADLVKCDQSLDGLLLIPVYPWGAVIDIMYMYVWAENSNNFAEIPEKDFEVSSRHQLQLIRSLLNSHKEVFWGMTMTLTRMSIPMPHSHISVLGQDTNNDAIQDFRKNTNWDCWLSSFVAKRVLKRIDMCLATQFTDYEIFSDNIGLDISIRDLPLNGDTSRELGSLLQKINAEINVLLVGVHDEFYNNSDLNELFTHIHNARNWSEYYSIDSIKAFFKDSNNNSPLTNTLSELKEMELLREPFSWGALFKFNNDNLTRIFIHFNFLNEEVGPFEGVWIKLAEHSDGATKNLNSKTIANLLSSEAFK